MTSTRVWKVAVHGEEVLGRDRVTWRAQPEEAAEQPADHHLRHQHARGHLPYEEAGTCRIRKGCEDVPAMRGGGPC